MFEEPGPSQAAPLTKNVYKKIRQRGVVQIGIIQDRPGLAYVGDNEPPYPSGFEVDLAEEVAEGLDAELLLVEPYLQPRSVRVVHTGAIYVLMSMATDLPGHRGLRLTIPYLRSVGRVLVDSNLVTEVADLNGERLCSVLGDDAIKQATSTLHASIERTPSLSACLKRLRRGIVKGALIEEASALRLQDRDLMPLADRFEGTAYRIAVQKRRRDLARKLNGILKDMKLDGTLKQLKRSWALD